MMTGMVTEGTVRTWHAGEGWGVVDSASTPGGCWTHFSHVAVPGFRSLEPGQFVELEWESAQQDGYAFRAVHVRPRGRQPDEPPADHITADGGSAYRSAVTITMDGRPPD
jgi:CspA family cold shock protein